MTDTALDADRRWIASQLGAIGGDGIRVLKRIVERVRIGEGQYGSLDIAADRRDPRSEGCDELTDWFWYRAWQEVAANDARLERLRCDAHDEIHGLIEPGLRELASFTMPDGDA
ncbi:MAG: hypothetical protein H0X39_01035 [Actinobacteria bacterium]|nr:hypothetical protein [Actinomycetota bacterium]